ncbi:hypothetical protein OLX02_03955 [Novosphingobium sp. KCTC 2891]|uniref:hypothetical protein n=1 Tax=Novosphingobium sp. KCTC 2891 TaxID=2989730 RepID=UPI0022222262|nr:hypothetical protein [Novosphingobium sp. KCTC 2891]MCW1381969.1 hypothetical protein [Novosphingobium sp. KCTC 2891]
MAQVFIATTNEARDPVTLVARHVEEAFRLLYRWREAHDPRAVGTDAMLVHLTDRDIADQSQLAELARSGCVGLAWWTGEREGWVLGVPDGEALGDIAPPSPAVRCFVFTTMEPGGTYVVAETLEQGIEMLNAHSQRLNGWDARYGEVVELSVWLLYGTLITLRVEMFAGKTGVARECEDGFFRIAPADCMLPVGKLDENGN